MRPTTAYNLTRDAEYRLDVPGYDHLGYGTSSPRPLNLPEAVRYAHEHGGVLQSAREAIAFRIAANGQDHANERQLNRTVAIYFQRDYRVCVVFDDHPTENILLARPQEAYDAAKNHQPWLVDAKDPLIQNAIARRTIHRRLIEAPDQSQAVPLRKRTYYEPRILGRALSDVARPYSHWLYRHGHKDLLIHPWVPTPVYNDAINEHTAEVCLVDIGGLDSHILSIGVPCDATGYARAVRALQRPA